MTMAEDNREELELAQTKIAQVFGHFREATALLGEIQGILLDVSQGTANDELVKAISLSESIKSGIDLYITHTYSLGATIYKYGNSL